MEKYKIDFANGCAIQRFVTQSGEVKNRRFMIFTDTKGLKILTNKGIVFLTECNSEVL